MAQEEKLKTFSNLDFHIISQELHSVVASLKNNKDVGLDRIWNEMLQCGISILSCDAKLFNTILTKHLDNFLKVNAIINPVQIGFTKKARTTDHMFVLRALIEKYKKDKCGKLFACFIDFRKGFDTVIPHIMLFKLLTIGIAGNFYNVIKDMYVGNHLRVRMQNGFTHYFCLLLGSGKVIH